jgi:hypothetical protein
MVFHRPRLIAELQLTAITNRRSRKLELSAREGGNARFFISGVKVDKLVSATYIAIARSEITFLLHFQFLEPASIPDGFGHRRSNQGCCTSVRPQ